MTNIHSTYTQMSTTGVSISAGGPGSGRKPEGLSKEGKATHKILTDHGFNFKKSTLLTGENKGWVHHAYTNSAGKKHGFDQRLSDGHVS